MPRITFPQLADLSLAALVAISQLSASVLAFQHPLVGVASIDPKPPSLDLIWYPIDSVNGAYFVDIEVGTPPQMMRLLYDTGSSDILLHSTADEEYRHRCAEEGPKDLCFAEYNNATSTTYREIAPEAYSFDFLDMVCYGSYITDTLTIAGSAVIQSQAMGSVWYGQVFVGLFGTAFRALEMGISLGTFPEYATWLERLMSNRVIDSATQSIWLDPSLGHLNGPDSFPNGSVTFGALDRSLFDGELIRVPVVNALNTSVADVPFNWNVALSGVAKQENLKQNFVDQRDGISCVLDTGTGFFALPNATFLNLLSSFPDAIRNTSLAFPIYHVPCSERSNPLNSLTFSFIDPRDDSVSATITVPPEQVVWPSHNVAPGGDPTTCALAAFSWEEYFGDSGLGGRYCCVLGVNVLKNAYLVLDNGNREAGIAKAKPKTEDWEADIAKIPQAGVKAVDFW